MTELLAEVSSVSLSPACLAVCRLQMSLDKACGLSPAHCVSSSARPPAEAVGLQKMHLAPKIQPTWSSQSENMVTVDLVMKI